MENNSEILMEIEMLQEIYINELMIEKNNRGEVVSVAMRLKPSTCENVDEQWVSIVVAISTSPTYPDTVPLISLRAPRGLSEEHVNRIKGSLSNLAEMKIGTAMLYELFEHARESLTASNVPHGECVICLDEFNSENCAFTRTVCYHFFHCACLLRYVKYCTVEHEKELALKPKNLHNNDSLQIFCPMCREPLPPSDLELGDHSLTPPCDIVQPLLLPESVREEQRRRADMFAVQLEKGGIIDLEAEKNKYLVPQDGTFFVALPTQPVETSQRDEDSVHSLDKTQHPVKNKSKDGKLNYPEKPFVKNFVSTREQNSRRRYAPLDSDCDETIRTLSGATFRSMAFRDECDDDYVAPFHYNGMRSMKLDDYQGNGSDETYPVNILDSEESIKMQTADGKVEKLCSSLMTLPSLGNAEDIVVPVEITNSIETLKSSVSSINVEQISLFELEREIIPKARTYLNNRSELSEHYPGKNKRYGHRDYNSDRRNADQKFYEVSRGNGNHGNRTERPRQDDRSQITKLEQRNVTIGEIRHAGSKIKSRSDYDGGGQDSTMSANSARHNRPRTDRRYNELHDNEKYAENKDHGSYYRLSNRRGNEPCPTIHQRVAESSVNAKNADGGIVKKSEEVVNNTVIFNSLVSDALSNAVSCKFPVDNVLLEKEANRNGAGGSGKPCDERSLNLHEDEIVSLGNAQVDNKKSAGGMRRRARRNSWKEHDHLSSTTSQSTVGVAKNPPNLLNAVNNEQGVNKQAMQDASIEKCFEKKVGAVERNAETMHPDDLGCARQISQEMSSSLMNCNEVNRKESTKISNSANYVDTRRQKGYRSDNHFSSKKDGAKNANGPSTSSSYNYRQDGNKVQCQNSGSSYAVTRVGRSNNTLQYIGNHDVPCAAGKSNDNDDKTNCNSGCERNGSSHSYNDRRRNSNDAASANGVKPARDVERSDYKPGKFTSHDKDSTRDPAYPMKCNDHFNKPKHVNSALLKREPTGECGGRDVRNNSNVDRKGRNNDK